MNQATDHPQGFYIVAREPGAEHPAIPTWANESENPAALDTDKAVEIERVDLDLVPGAFQLLNVLTPAECRQLLNLSESLGYLADAAVSLPRSVRHNDSLTWVTDLVTTDLIWQRCSALVNQDLENYSGKKALGLNARFRFYRYQTGDYFSPHSDGAWPGSAIVDGELIANAYQDRWSQLTFLLFLSDDYSGGSTEFYIDSNNASQPASDPGRATVVKIKTPIGGILCFPHGMHPLHCLHSSEPISSGKKYIIRSDVLFEI
jgi:hypothetical protein